MRLNYDGFYGAFQNLPTHWNQAACFNWLTCDFWPVGCGWHCAAPHGFLAVSLVSAGWLSFQLSAGKDLQGVLGESHCWEHSVGTSFRNLCLYLRLPCDLTWESTSKAAEPCVYFGLYVIPSTRQILKPFIKHKIYCGHILGERCLSL